jgi:PelA/Pel-15E family pectate lyase
MKKATQFMMNNASYNGGFVWSYLPDFSRSWGEVEAYRTMAWVQSPGTPAVGQLLLDAYHATGDEYYYESAKKVASALIWGQLPCGGWNYMFDFAGENSLKQWYATIGKSAWRLEEFQHYYGNATFDDAASVDAARFLLRIYIEKYDPVFRPALDKAISFVLDSQYPIGGWPQRYPLMYDHVFHGKTDYSSFITLNDDVIPENIDFLIQCYQTMGLQNLREPIMRAMNLMIALQQGIPYAGWADQYTVSDLQPAYARSYEPRSINTGTTVRMINVMIDYYHLTGETKFLARIPDAIAFLESQALPESEVKRFNRNTRENNVILVPRFVHPETGRPQYVHRTGSNVYNGEYYTDENISNTIGHYASAIYVNILALRQTYEDALKESPAELKSRSPLFSTEKISLPKYYTAFRPSFGVTNNNLEDEISELIISMTKGGYWISPISISYPYKLYPEEGVIYLDNEYMSTNVGDEYDTSCYRQDGQTGISTGVFIANMRKFIRYIDEKNK